MRQEECKRERKRQYDQKWRDKKKQEGKDD